jgi:hypothetical protein
MTDLVTNYILQSIDCNIIYISVLFLVGIFYNYHNISIKIIIKYYLYFIAFHILNNLYKYMEIVIKYIIHHTIIALIIISISYFFTYFLKK